jgi:hypothetical protein
VALSQIDRNAIRRSGEGTQERLCARQANTMLRAGYAKIPKWVTGQKVGGNLGVRPSIGLRALAVVGVVGRVDQSLGFSLGLGDQALILVEPTRIASSLLASHSF